MYSGIKDMGVFRSSLRTSERYKVRLAESDHFAVLQTCYLPEHSGKSILPFAQARFQNRPQKRQCRRDAAFSGTGAVYTKPRFERKKSEKIRNRRCYIAISFQGQSESAGILSIVRKGWPENPQRMRTNGDPRLACCTVSADSSGESVMYGESIR
jgi:hypothetical protein